MRAVPSFPPYKVTRPPVAKRWIAAASLMGPIAGGCSALLRKTEVSSGSVIIAMLFVISVVGTLWLFRLWYYRCSVHNATLWQQEVNAIQQQWWIQHRRQFGLLETVLIGPAGSNELEWERVFRRETLPPKARGERGFAAFRIARTFSEDADERDQQLARMLVLQWIKQPNSSERLSPARCYWAGSNIAWRAFTGQMKLTFPDVVLPEEPKPWRGEETLAELAEMFADAAPDTQALVAGCQSLTASATAVRPASETAVLWLVGATAPVVLARGELFEPTANESILQVCQRAQIQSELEQVPEYCMLFSPSGQPELASCGWNVTQHLQDSYWGESGEMEPLVAISLAAIFARTQKQPCGWIAADPLHTLALGIIKPYG